jgi:hypothetical protein
VKNEQYNRSGLEKYENRCTKGKIKDFGDFLENKKEELEQLLIEREMRRRKREEKKCASVKEKVRID